MEESVKVATTAYEFFAGIGIGLVVMYFGKDWFRTSILRRK